MLSPGHRLLCHALHRSDYDLYVACSRNSMRSWTEIVAVTPQGFTAKTGEQVPVDQVSQFVVSYPNGQIADCELVDRLPPEETHFLDDDGDFDDRHLHMIDLRKGSKYLRVEFEPSPARPDDANYYKTSLTNISTGPVHITGFAPAAVRRLLGRVRSLRTGRRYSADEFANWYGAPDALLLPGQKACDPNNWGRPPVAWIYYFRLCSGVELIGGGLVR